MPPATISVPPAPACYDVTDPQPGMTKLPPVVDCGASHTLETVHVGGFSGADAATDVPPPDGGPVQQRAYADCTKTVDALVGGDWRTGRIGLDLTLPSPAQWEAGARWYRCDVVEFADLDSYAVVGRTGSMQGALTGPRPLALGCFKVAIKGEDIDTMVATDCAAPHNSEFAGVWDAPPGVYPADAGQRQSTQLNGCRGVIASYTGVPNDGMVRYRTGQITFGFGKADWDLGNRGARCYLWLDNKSLTRSLKGAGTRGLPVNTA
nr:septum formation family protein [Planosporangium thailandense]